MCHSVNRAFDRGYDANIYYGDLLDHQEMFVIRAKKKNGKQADCKISIVPIRLYCRPKEELNLVVCRNLGQEPMLLITNMKSDDPRLAATVTKVYLLRWRIEEFYGFKKQQFDFEDFRVRSLTSIRNLDLLLTIAIGYIGMMSERVEERRTVMELIHISKRIFGVPRFKFYAIADGLFAVFARCKQGVTHLLRKKPKDHQLSLFNDFAFACV